MGIKHDNDGTICKMEPQIIPGVKQVLEEFKPELIIELGFLLGGFTKYLVNWFPEVPIYTIDIVYRVSEKDAKFFKNKGKASFIVTSQLFRNDIILPLLLALPQRKFFICDNGEKPDEVRSFAGFLRPGDLLAVHDYGTEVFKEQVAPVLNEFIPHPYNREYKKYTMRFFTKMRREGRYEV